MTKKITGLFAFALMISSIVYSQNNEKADGLHLTTGVGFNKIQGKLGNTFRSTVAFNSGFEKSFKNNWYGQLEANFNTLKYDQRELDGNSDYLFQNTNSSLFMIGVNFGKDFHFGETKWFASPYVGAGYLNIGEPRLQVHEPTGIVTQEVVRQAGAFGKAGGRIGYSTRSKLLQTIYLDGSYWSSSLKTSGQTFRSISVFIGLRMTM
jgi:hypothetical protein